MPKGSVRNPVTAKTITARRARAQINSQDKSMKNVWRTERKELANRQSAKANQTLMKSPGAGRAAVKPIKKTIRPAMSAKKGK